MRKISVILCLISFTYFAAGQDMKPDKELENFFADYTEQYYKLFPVNATVNGDYRYNDKLPVTFTDSYNEIVRAFYQNWLNNLRKFDRTKLNDNDKISYDIFTRNMEMGIEGFNYKLNRMPFNQFDAFSSQMGQLGNGTGAQPFKTVQQYDAWITRAKLFTNWADSAIIYFRKGISENIVLPKALVIKMIPQLQALQTSDVTKSVFYGPVTKFPETFSGTDKTRLTKDFEDLIKNNLNPAYRKLQDFMQNGYLSKARETSGYNALPNGNNIYDYAIRQSTTTNKSAEEIFNIGLSEVKRIRTEMEKVRQQVNYKSSLDSFFVFTKTDPQFLPYDNAEQILNDYRKVLKKISPHLDELFSVRPKTSFEVRQTEAFRAASAAAQYNSGLPDGSRPGIFYVPIVDPKKYTKAKENLFIHEAIPGHHFQVMLQKENTSLPKFRQDGGFSAFSEGWGLYCESLGKLLGCYTDPYQYFYALGDEMHRAIRLVVDVGLHSKGWTREKAIEYMRSNEPITEQSATAEIERYMARPGQALSYKIGELK